MKGGLHGLRGKQISLTLIVLICGTIFIWAWDKTSLLGTSLPPQDQLLKPYPGIIMREPVRDLTPVIHANIDLEDTIQEGEKNTPDKVEETIPSTEEKGFQSGLLDQPEHEEIRLPVKKTPDSGTPVGTNVYKTGKDENSDAEEKKVALSGPSVEQNIPKQGHNEERITEPVVKNLDSGMLMGSETTESYETEKYENSNIDLREKKDCNYGKGKWAEDSSRPLYSGFECKQWLSEMWACKLTQRLDFSYESFRWHPNNCEMPEFEGSSFLKRMQDKTIAMVGDSLGRQQFQSLMCMVTGGKLRSDVLDVGGEYGLIKANGATRPDGWALRFTSTNTTILYYWSASLTDLTPIDITNPATNWAMHLDRPPAFLSNYLHRFDVLVLNTGHHWNRGKLNANRWVMYVGGVPNTNRKIAEIGGAKNFTIYSVVRWLDSQLPTHPKLKAFFRTISPRHFFHGDWNTGGSCDNTTPLAGGKEVVQDESSDPIVSGAVKGTGVKLLDITALSELRDEGHISRYSIKATPGVQDCLHWCLPGVPDTWNEILAAQV